MSNSFDSFLIITSDFRMLLLIFNLGILCACRYIPVQIKLYMRMDVCKPMPLCLVVCVHVCTCVYHLNGFIFLNCIFSWKCISASLSFFKIFFNLITFWNYNVSFHGSIFFNKLITFWDLVSVLLFVHFMLRNVFSGFCF